jgi:hypothetical protein
MKNHIKSHFTFKQNQVWAQLGHTCFGNKTILFQLLPYFNKLGTIFDHVLQLPTIETFGLA